ncbi:MAG: iron-containing redox enzyme family protein [Alphaproteobacteria bacterium]|nr:iron-containing redox enzyme family protein [Alphaproteobacteria bacterium]MCW5749541.1 iron-containing redox enzyme family protein [Alphaproteobacteria bacterium]
MSLASTAENNAIADSPTRTRIYSETSDTTKYIDDIYKEILRSCAVEHPFLNWFANNKLSKDQEKILFSECYYWFRHIPFYISSMAQLTRDTKILKEISLNVYDEVGGERSHAELYMKFINTIGISKREVQRYHPTAQVLELNGRMEKIYSRPPIEKALGAMFFDETMSGIMVSKINEGLKNAGYSKDIRFFWEMHINVENGHSNSIFNAIYPYLKNDASQDAFEDGVQELSRLVELFWDAVVRKLNLHHILHT